VAQFDICELRSSRRSRPAWPALVSAFGIAFRVVLALAALALLPAFPRPGRAASGPPTGGHAEHRDDCRP
jgi:hypothetical protein